MDFVIVLILIFLTGVLAFVSLGAIQILAYEFYENSSLSWRSSYIAALIIILVFFLLGISDLYIFVFAGI